jgi:expansin (peptidoglycan-binding protein)
MKLGRIVAATAAVLLLVLGAGITAEAASSTSSAASGVLGAGRIKYGRTYTGDGTYYAATGAGNCMYEAGGNLMVAAMNQTDYENSRACGDYLAITGPNGTVTVKIVDRCPECAPGDVDLSREAFAKIAPISAGRVKISWRLLSPTLSGPVAYRYKEGSSRYWCAIQVRNHRNPVRFLDVLTGGSWHRLPRQEYNYFVSADGAGCGSSIRVTDIYGNRVTDSTIALKVGVVQKGAHQFGPPR